MSIPFWRSLRGIGAYRPDGKPQLESREVNEDHPLPVQIFNNEDEDTPRVVISKILPLEEYYPVDHETVTVSTTAAGLTQSKYQNADRAFITLETAQVRFRYDGAAAPTSTTGHVLDVAVPLALDGQETMRRFQAIRTGGSDGTLTVTYEKRR